jgi:hypothetical protein
MRAWLMGGVVFMGGFIFLSCSALAQTERTPCEDVSSPLPYASYGIGFPKGEETLWKCDAKVDEKTSSVTLARWQKEEKKILFGEYNIGELGNPDFEETVRDYFEAFLSDKHKKYEDMHQMFLDTTKGVLFGKNNNKIVVYHFDDEILSSSGKNMAVAFVHKKDSDKYLNINCSACSFDEFMSYIVVPVIQE